MTVKLSAAGWLQLFTQSRTPNQFLTRMFTLKPGGAHNGKTVTIDIKRFGEQVAVAVKRFHGSNMNDFDLFTTKEFTPPHYSEGFPADVAELLERQAGEDPYSAAYAEYTGKLVTKLMQGYNVINDKIVRSVELQASQILQTGQLNLIDQNGNVTYELDFKPKATHFPTVGVPWATVATADPLGDLEALADVIRADGKVDPDRVIMGSNALKNFLKNQEVKDQLDNKGMTIGQIAPEMQDSGAKFYGFIHIGAYEFQIWTYPETYEHPQTGATTKYIGADNVVMLSTRTRLDMTFAGEPTIGSDPRLSGLMPGRMTDRQAGFDVTPNLYCTPDGRQIIGDLYSNPLLVPVQIDGFGCVKTAV